jgi:hypothetical protein
VLKHLLLVVITVCSVNLLQNLLLLHVVLPNGGDAGHFRKDVQGTQPTSTSSSLIAVVHKVFCQEWVDVIVLIVVLLYDRNET